jgi:hypothetical protein
MNGELEEEWLYLPIFLWPGFICNDQEQARISFSWNSNKVHSNWSHISYREVLLLPYLEISDMNMCYDVYVESCTVVIMKSKLLDNWTEHKTYCKIGTIDCSLQFILCPELDSY